MLTSMTTTPPAGSVSGVVQQHNLDVLIVGGGLSGLIVAHELEKHETPWNYMVVEARNVLGGRLVNDIVHDDIDLGGAWFWPPEQELMSDLVNELGIVTFEQPPVNPFISTRRFQGGAVQLIRQLSRRIPKDRIMMNTPVTMCQLVLSDQQCQADKNNQERDATKIRVEATTDGSASFVFLANRVIFCVPPKLLTKHVTFDPPLSQAKQRAMKQSNTWMAGVTKVALVYKNQFWKDDFRFQNLVGRLGGPAFQLYDSSTAKVSAVTAFTLAQSGDTNNDDEGLARKVASQVAQAFRLLGEEHHVKQALAFDEFYIQRWPLEKYISEEPNPTQIQPHPYPVQALSAVEWDGRLLFAGTESDRESPGVMEGAVGSAIRVKEQLFQS